MTLLPGWNSSEFVRNAHRDLEFTSIIFTKAVDRVLNAAGLVRKQPGELRIGLTSINVFSQDIKDAVPVCIETGIHIHVNSREPIAALQSRLVEDLPVSIKSAITLRSVFAFNVSPPDERNVGDKVAVDPGEEGPMIICVGKKP